MPPGPSGSPSQPNSVHGATNELAQRKLGKTGHDGATPGSHVVDLLRLAQRMPRGTRGVRRCPDHLKYITHAETVEQVKRLRRTVDALALRADEGRG